MINFEFLRFQNISREQMTDEVYFGMKNHTSNSQMKLINPEEGGTPSRFVEGFSGQRNSNALVKGTAVHQLTLESDLYYLAEVTRPDNKLGDIADAIIYYRGKGLSCEESIIRAICDTEYYKGKLTDSVYQKVRSVFPYVLSKIFGHQGNKTPIYVPNSELDNVKGAVKALSECKTVQQLLHPKGAESYCEDVILGEAVLNIQTDVHDPNSMKEVTIPVKIKIDNWTINHKTKEVVLNDVKTTGHPVGHFGGYYEDQFGALPGGGFGYVPSFRQGSFQSFRYFRQLSFYSQLLMQYVHETFGKEYKLAGNYMLVVESFSPKANAGVYQVGDISLKKGEEEFKSLLARIGFHKVNGFDKAIELMEKELNVIL